MQTLVLRGGAVGDFILTIPALRLLRTRWPESRIELAGNAPAARLALADHLLDAVHSQHESRWAALYSADPLPPAFAAWLASFDLIVNFWPDPDGDLSRQLAPLPRRFLNHSPHPPAGRSTAAHLCAALAPLDLHPADLRASLAFSLSDHHAAAALLPGPGRAVAIHPGSGSPRKNWPLARWHDLAKKIAPDRPVLWITGPADSHLPPPAGAAIIHSSGQPLGPLGATLARCAGFIGHDTGIGHLAAATGIACLLLFGPTDPAVWAPAGDHVRILRSPTADLADLPLAEVLAAWSHTNRHGFAVHSGPA